MVIAFLRMVTMNARNKNSNNPLFLCQHAAAQAVNLAGSGPALFTLMEDKNQAEKLYENLQKKELESYLIDTLPAIEQLE